MIGTNLNLPFLKKPDAFTQVTTFLANCFFRRTFKIIPFLYIYVLLFKLDPLSWPISNPRDRDLNIPESKRCFLQVSVSIQKVFFKRRIHVFLKNTNNVFYNSLLFPWKRLIKTNLNTLPLRMNWKNQVFSLFWSISKVFLWQKCAWKSDKSL